MLFRDFEGVVILKKGTGGVMVRWNSKGKSWGESVCTCDICEVLCRFRVFMFVLFMFDLVWGFLKGFIRKEVWIGSVKVLDDWRGWS